MQNFYHLLPSFTYLHVPLQLATASGARGGEKPFSPPLHWVISLVPLSHLGLALAVPPGKGGQEK